MKILSAEQIRATDRATIENEPVSSVDLMERAASAVFERIRKVFDKQDAFDILCGPGNNGGDGWVIARLLHLEGYDCCVYTPSLEGKLSPDARYMADKAVGLGVSYRSLEAFNVSERIVVDALFGSGLDRPLKGAYGDLVTRLNESSAFVIAVDIPSGMKAEENEGMEVENMVQADWTLSLQLPKLAFFTVPYGECAGHVEIIDIGLDQEFIDAQDTSFHYLSTEEAAAILKKRPKFSHKGTYGHGLLIAGSEGKAGAAILAARAALRSGMGLLSVASPEKCMESIHCGVPEAMIETGLGSSHLEHIPKLDSFHAVAAGPGIGLAKETERIIYALIQSFEGPLLFDADALNILAENKTWLAFLSGRAILTPHPGEMDRLLGSGDRGMDQILKTREFARKFGLLVVLKGAHTAVILPDGAVSFNGSGNNGMATAGSGDTLSGIILGLLAQGYSLQQGALLGVHLHGLAGDLALEKGAEESLIATDISDHLPESFRILKMM
jgi:NAD(P)H-hydrate epimerase